MGTDETFRAFLAADQAALLRLAVLLADDRGDAEDLLQRALLTCYRHWGRITRAGTPSADVRRLLVMTHLASRRRRIRPQELMEDLPQPSGYAPPLEPEDEELEQALRALPRAMRTAIVLRLYEDLSEERTAELMGSPAGTVQAETAGASDWLGTSDGELSGRLESLAYRAAPPPRDADELTATLRARHRTRRRRQWTLAAVAAASAAVLVVPIAVPWTAQDRGSAAPAPGAAGVYDTPTRGSRSHSGNLVEGVRRLPWTNGPAGADVPEPALDTRHVVWAGDVGGERWALVAGADPGGPLPPDQDGDGRRELGELDSVAIAWFTGSGQATAEEMTLFSVPRVVDADEPTALADSTGRAVIVAAPDDRIEKSFIMFTESDGTARWDYAPVDEARAGVDISGPFENASLDRSLHYRVVRDGRRIQGSVDVYPNPDHRFPSIGLTYLRPAPAPAPGDQAVPAAVDELFGRTGISAPFVTSFNVHWAGDLATLDGGTARLAVLAVQMPLSDGRPYYVTGALGLDAGDGEIVTTSCGSEFRPQDPPQDQAVFVVRCNAAADSLVIVAPPHSAVARALDTDGRVLTEYPLTDGVAVVPTPAGLATVEVIDAVGVTVDERAPMGEADFGD